MKGENYIELHVIRIEPNAGVTNHTSECPTREWSTLKGMTNKRMVNAQSLT